MNFNISSVLKFPGPLPIPVIVQSTHLKFLLIANIDGSNAADITVEVSIDNGSNYFAIASTVSVPADASIVVIGKDNSIYLDETDLLAVTASANSDLVACVSYELMKDA